MSTTYDRHSSASVSVFVFGYVRSSGNEYVCSFVGLVQTCLEILIFIFRTQIFKLLPFSLLSSLCRTDGSWNTLSCYIFKTILNWTRFLFQYKVQCLSFPIWKFGCQSHMLRYRIRSVPLCFLLLHSFHKHQQALQQFANI